MGEIFVRSKRKIRAAFLAGSAGFALLATAGTAQAADTRIDLLNGSGYAEWTENGDTLTVRDTRSDGRGVRAYIYRPYAGGPGNGDVLIKASSGGNGCVAVREDISETIRINIKVVNSQGSDIINPNWRVIR
ncbi:hypothetical protein [Streptomyces sp. NPDC048659]|uniref:hypothetical protein n=1 Tax=Streptomyces sp. NPDC048659 TaxID=3155489 RepID=UPI003420B9C4